MKVSNPPSTNPYQAENTIESVKGNPKLGKNQGYESVITKSESSSHAGANVEISDNAKLMRQASDIAKAATEIRKDKIAALKKNIQDGTYHVEANEIADRLVEEHLNANFGKNNL